MNIDDYIPKEDALTYALEQGLLEIDDVVSWIESAEAGELLHIFNACKGRLIILLDEERRKKK